MQSTKSDELFTLYGGKAIAKNIIFNLLGYGIPLVVAIAFIPILIKGLGEERFGILNLVWVVIGYFSFFDFGIGRALTKIIAEKIGSNTEQEIPKIFWTSFFLMVIFSLLGSIILFIIAPSIGEKFFNISQELQPETTSTIYLLAFSIPIVTTTAGLRGVLEAYQKFGIVNIIRIALGVFTFVGPLFCLFFTDSLFWIVLILVFIRIIVWILYLHQSFKINSKLKSSFKFDPLLVKPVLLLSGWMTVSNIVGPLITYLDRFLIGAIISASAIAYYATPYEVVTKLFVVPTALAGVLFPVFSASYKSQPLLSQKLFLKGCKFILILLYPVILFIITFANEGMTIWLGQTFADKSTVTLQLLAIGVLLNSFAHFPFTFLQGIGRADIPAKINLLELPFYALIMWFTVKEFGINGAAFAWMIMNLVNTIIQFLIVNKLISLKYESKFGILVFITLSVGLIIPFFLGNIYSKLFWSSGVLIIFIFMTSKYFLYEEEKMFLNSIIKIPRFLSRSAN